MGQVDQDMETYQSSYDCDIGETGLSCSVKKSDTINVPMVSRTGGKAELEAQDQWKNDALPFDRDIYSPFWRML